MFRLSNVILVFLLLAQSAAAQSLNQDWDYEEGVDDDLLFLHPLINYAHDLYWQLEWERRLFVDNGMQLNIGSVSASQLYTVAALNVNHDLNDKWRFQARVFRDETLHLPDRDAQFFVGLERAIGKASSLFAMATPQFNKEAIDVYAGYTFYRDDRQQYVRAGILWEDANFEDKNELGGTYEQQPMALQWAARLGTDSWWVFSEGRVGSGFERAYDDADASPELLRHKRRSNFARLKFTWAPSDQVAWSAWADWYDFSETRLYRVPGFDYEYVNEQYNLAAEYIRTIRDRHRLRFLLHYVEVEAGSQGFNEHDYDRTDVLGGAFYEYLWSRNVISFAYAMAQPEARYTTLDDFRNVTIDGYHDKAILGWRHIFSADAQILISVSQELSAGSFGGGNLQFQLFF